MPEPSGRLLDISAPARRDLLAILRVSLERFGGTAEARYDALIRQALHDLLTDPQRPGARQRPELSPDIYIYHLASSRTHTAGRRVITPRHIIVYRIQQQRIQVLRILHESRDLARHIAST